MKRIAGSKEALDENYPIYILWEITQRCNYWCSYCDQYARKQSELSWDNIKKILYKLESSNHNIIIDLFGGEPTLNSNYLKILDYLKTSKIKCITTSNGYKNKQFFQEIVDKYSTKFEFTLSYHHECSKIDEFVEKINILGSNGVKVNVTYICHPQYFEEIKAGYEKIINSKFSTLNLKYLWDYRKTNIYSDEYLKWIEEHLYDNQDRYFIDEKEYTIYDLKKQNLDNFKGWDCQANKVLFINYMGMVYRQCFKFWDIPLFNIVLEKDINKLFNRKNEYITCPSDECGCDMYLKVLKWKDQ